MSVRSSPAKTTVKFPAQGGSRRQQAGAVFLPGRFIFAEFGKGGKFGRSPRAEGASPPPPKGRRGSVGAPCAPTDGLRPLCPNPAEIPARKRFTVGRNLPKAVLVGELRLTLPAGDAIIKAYSRSPLWPRLLHGIVVLILQRPGFCFFGYENILLQEVPE